MPRVLIPNLSDSGVVRSAGELLREWTFDKTKWENLTPAEVKAELAATGLDLSNIQGIVVSQSSTDTLHIVLPPAECLQIGIDEIRANAPGYRIQEGYTDFVLDRHQNGGNYDEVDEVLAFYDFRIGDYTLQHCM